MDFFFEILIEIILTPIIEGYAFAMMLFKDKNKKINKDKMQIFVVFECIVLLVSFFIGGIMLLETSGESLLGKIFIFSSLGISVFQIIVGCVLKKIIKDRQY